MDLVKYQYLINSILANDEHFRKLKVKVSKYRSREGELGLRYVMSKTKDVHFAAGIQPTQLDKPELKEFLLDLKRTAGF